MQNLSLVRVKIPVNGQSNDSPGLFQKNLLFHLNPKILIHTDPLQYPLVFLQSVPFETLLRFYLYPFQAIISHTKNFHIVSVAPFFPIPLSMTAFHKNFFHLYFQFSLKSSNGTRTNETVVLFQNS